MSLLTNVSSVFLTSALEVGALLLQSGGKVLFGCLLISSLTFHVGLILSPAVMAMLVGMATVPVSCLPVAVVMIAMFLDLSLCQQACGLPSARASMVFLVLPIEL